MTASTLGRFVLDTARGDRKTNVMPADQAKEVRDQLAARISEKVEEIRAQERRARDSAKTVTVF
jgi:hypothetical protein